MSYLVAVLDGRRPAQERLEWRLVRFSPRDAAGRKLVQHSQQQIAVLQALAQISNGRIPCLQERAHPHTEGALLPGLL